MNQIHKHHIVPKWRCKELGTKNSHWDIHYMIRF
jgi:hypothetical protein